ncbi:helix-turn-helix domain-containing protein [Streptomyces sp. NPDC007346]|uniref:helix-turn-helix domain-containing protein n=1 Tax=Streptomyces sp. NPDC007346 TaxID=3154682 RepID=UPI0034517C2C
MSTTAPAARLTTKYRARLKGDKRTETGWKIAAEYVAGASVRAVAESAGLSYGTARVLLLEAGVTLRPRGGSRR